jgi:ribosome-associated toxin RatA of RatAB toxin-antitoxin module
MTDQATEHQRIDAPPQAPFDVAVDFEHYPQWARDIKEATVLERDAEGRGTLVQFRAAAFGRSARYTLRYDYSDAPHELSWVLERGDIMRKLDGRYVFEPADAGNATDVTYHLEVELIIPIPGFIKRRAEGKIMHTALDELRKRVESKELA